MSKIIYNDVHANTQILFIVSYWMQYKHKGRITHFAKKLIKFIKVQNLSGTKIIN